MQAGNLLRYSQTQVTFQDLQTFQIFGINIFTIL
jgi:hypothetical protein